MDPEELAEYEHAIQVSVARATNDLDLREDLAQEARIALLSVNRSRIKSQTRVYCNTVIEFTVRKTVVSYNRGDWYTARHNYNKHKMEPGRFVSIDQFGKDLQIDEDGNIYPPGQADKMFGAYYLQVILPWIKYK